MLVASTISKNESSCEKSVLEIILETLSINCLSPRLLSIASSSIALVNSNLVAAKAAAPSVDSFSKASAKTFSAA